MPETGYDTDKLLAEIRWTSEEYIAHKASANEQYIMLGNELRNARAAGVTLRALSDAAQLSIAQVQRICDLSKDASPKELAAKEWRKNGGKGYFASEDELAEHLSKDRSE